MGNRVFSGLHGLGWRSASPRTKADIEEIDHFDARGMRCVYGRGDHFGRPHTYHMDIFLDRQGRLFMRWWARSKYIAWRSFEIKGVDTRKIRPDNLRSEDKDRWVPRAARDSYAEWIMENMDDD